MSRWQRCHFPEACFELYSLRVYPHHAMICQTQVSGTTVENIISNRLIFYMEFKCVFSENSSDSGVADPLMLSLSFIHRESFGLKIKRSTKLFNMLFTSHL